MLRVEYLMRARSEILYLIFYDLLGVKKVNLLISSAHDQLYRSDCLGYS